MSTGKKLSEVEKGKILAYIELNKSISEISTRIGRSRKVIANFLALKDEYGTKKRLGRPRRLSIRTSNAVVKFAAKYRATTTQIKAHFRLNVSSDTILRILHRDGALERRKLKRKPILKQVHKEQRLNFAKTYMDFGEKWKNVIFSDEKKFNLDGPDGYSYYWHALGSKSQFLSKRAMGGGSLMVWGSFSFFGASEIVFVNETLNSDSYQHVLGNYLLPFIYLHENREMIFQQDNARPHVSISTLDWIEDAEIERLMWPPYSPDLNPIENLWGILVQRVYANGRQFDTVDQLRETIIYEWKNIELSILQSLILSMKSRIYEVLVKNGSNTKY